MSKSMTAMAKTDSIRMIVASLTFLVMVLFALAPRAQSGPHSTRPRFPWACLYFDPGRGEVEDAKDEPKEEQEYSASVKELYRLWCTPVSSTLQQRQTAEDDVASLWKRIWYRENPFSAEFHETGSFALLVPMRITHRVPQSMIDDPVFMKDWLNDCSDRCFMLYDDDDPGANREWAQMMRLRKMVIDGLGSDPTGRQVKKMLKNAKLYPVN
ncbi:MAG: hypothetical protein ACLPY1_01560 [Terracidiphilus sp.]